MLQIDIIEDPPAALDTYAAIPSALLIEEVYDVYEDDAQPGGAELVRREITTPYIKDYDRPDSEHPSRWPERFDVSKWGFLTGAIGGREIARAAIAWGSERDAILWDIRVAPAFQRRGVGTVMFEAAEDWARKRGAARLAIETQNVNVAACMFYARQGCQLGSVQRFAYTAFPDEVQLLWYKDLNP